MLTDIEIMDLNGTQFCGGTADIHKFFDQILRPLVYKLAELAGMPQQILSAYSRFLEGLRVYNSLAGGVGHAYSRQCGIPQGCPFSMMMVALIMRPWVRLMVLMGTTPRVLADDVLIIAVGKKLLGKYARALNATHQYLHDLGAKIAPAKSFNLPATPRVGVG